MLYRDGSEANRTATGRGLSKQSWSLVEKIRSVDGLLRTNASARSKIREVHPELLFWGMNGGRPLEHPKRRKEGFQERLRILEEHFAGAGVAAAEALRTFPRSQVAPDDVLDALAASIVGWRSKGSLDRIPVEPATDAAGLPMEMVYWSSAGLPAR
jgi:predicted RNase H-like nuclease